MKGIRNTESYGSMATKQVVKKMIPQLLLSLSIFSFLLSSSLIQSYSPSTSPKLHIHCYNASANSPFLNKNCLFLICNGLLVFLARTSGFLVQPPPRGYDLADPVPLDKLGGDSDYETPEAMKGIGKRPTEEVSIAIAESEEEAGEEPRRFWIFDEDESQQVLELEQREPGDEDEQDAEELNRRFEEFITRMKEEILIGTEAARISSSSSSSQELTILN